MSIRVALNHAYILIVSIGLIIFYFGKALMHVIPRAYRKKSINNEIVLVTGGARGIGKLVAKKLAERGARVIIWDISKPDIEETVNQIKKIGGQCWGYYCNVADKEQVYKVAKTVQIEIGNVTMLINNAGYACAKLLWETPDDEIERTFKINILSHYWITKAFLKEMMRNNHGHIVTVASLAGIAGGYRASHYAATKHATVGYHESLCADLSIHKYNGIHLTLVCPYFIDTGFFSGFKPRFIRTLKQEYVSEEIVWGILTNRSLIVLPGYLRYILPLKWYIPTKLIWGVMYYIYQMPQRMAGFTTRKLELLEERTYTDVYYTDVLVR